MDDTNSGERSGFKMDGTNDEKESTEPKDTNDKRTAPMIKEAC